MNKMEAGKTEEYAALIGFDWASKSMMHGHGMRPRAGIGIRSSHTRRKP